MKRPTAYLLVFLFLFSSLVPKQDWTELAKLPALMEHFREHKAEALKLSLIQFFTMHYGEGFDFHSSAHDHSNLPLKNHGENFHGPDATALLLQILPVLFVPFSNEENRSISENTYHFIPLHDIWQPPKA